jgi:phenylalanyl-tRNA synthetase beta chain
VARALARSGDTVIAEREMLAVALAGEGDDARAAAAAWLLLSDAFGILDVEVVAPEPASAPAGLHPTRSARLMVTGSQGRPGRSIGIVGEVDPGIVGEFGLDPELRRVGWLEVDLEALLTEATRRSPLLAPVSRFPSSDVDLAFVVDDAVAAAAVEKTLRVSAGAVLEALSLFDVYRGPVIGEGARSLAYRLRLCALDHTLTDEEVAEIRARCIAAVENAHGARLRS